MKRIVLFALCLTLAVSISACSSNTEPGEASAEESVSASAVEESSSAPSEAEDVPLAPEFLVEELGLLLAGPMWDDAAKIPVDDLLSWYVYTNHLQDANALKEYLDDSGTAYQIPLDEIQSAVLSKFDLTDLPVDAAFYDTTSGLCMIPSGKESAEMPAFEVTKVEQNDSASDIHLALTFADGRTERRILTIAESGDDGVVFSSYIDPDGNAPVAGEHAAESESADTASGGNVSSEAPVSASSAPAESQAPSTPPAASSQAPSKPTDGDRKTVDGVVYIYLGGIGWVEEPGETVIIPGP